ncbi:MAG: hypothetical protein U0Z26_09415 [Anaerolineales bacterium]
MKFWKIGLRTWIAIGSLTSFLAGWVLFSHSPKPVQPVTVSMVTLPTLEPLPSMQSGAGDDNGFFQPSQSFTVQQQPSFFNQGFGPRIVTSGS